MMKLYLQTIQVNLHANWLIYMLIWKLPACNYKQLLETAEMVDN